MTQNIYIKNIIYILTTVLLLHFPVIGEGVLRVTQLTGSAKIQRADKRNWTNLKVGEYIGDNDIVETFFKAKLILNYKRDNIIILGSNSKALINISNNKNGVLEINSTLFSGGIFVKAVNGCSAGIFTSNGIAKTDSGVVSTIVDSRTGYTGIQILGGSAKVRNISQQKDITLRTGQTTIIHPNKKPTAPLYITDKHVKVLSHFFGYENVNKELKVSQIDPTESIVKKATESPKKLTVNNDRIPQEIGSYPALFNLNKIYGSILLDRKKNARSYTYFKMPEKLTDNKLQLHFRSNFGITNGTVYPIIDISPSINLPKFAFGLRFPVVRNANGNMGLEFDGFPAILDKIDFFKINVPGKFDLNIGPINDYTIANGVVVNNYSNKDPYSTLNTVGLTSKITMDDFYLRTMISDISDFGIGGLNIAWEPSYYTFGVGFYWDGNMYTPLKSKDYARYTTMPKFSSELSPNPDSTKANARIWEIDIAVQAISTYSVSLKMDMGIAGSFLKTATNGLVVKGPNAILYWKKIKIGLGFNSERGQLIVGHFHKNYASNRLRILNQDTVTILKTQSNIFDKFWNGKKSYSTNLIFGVSPVNGTSFNLDVTQDIAWRQVFSDTNSNGTRRYPDDIDSGTYKGDLSFDLTLAIDSNLIKQIRYGEVFFRQVHGGYYPEVGSFFANWGAETGFNVVTAPLFFNISLEAGLKFYYLDIDDLQKNKFNNNIDPGDNVIEAYLGARWGFM